MSEVEKIGVFGQSVAVCQKRYKLGRRLLLFTNRRSHKRVRLVQTSRTFYDLEWPLRTIAQNMRLSEPGMWPRS